MAIVIFNKNDTREEIHNKLFGLFEFDEDHNGNNDNEHDDCKYTLNEAIEKGYDSNLDYWIGETLSIYKDPYNAIETILQKIADIFSKDAYYEYVDFETLEKTYFTVATVLYKSKD